MSCWCGHRPWQALAEYLQDLEEEIGQVREELEQLRRSRGTEAS